MQFQLQGNLVSDIVLNRSEKGTAWAYIKVASDNYSSTGQKLGTAFISLKVFGEQAELAAVKLGKGDMVKAEGHVESSTYQKDGKTVYDTSFIVAKGCLELLFKRQIKAVEPEVVETKAVAKKPAKKKTTKAA